jgi:hypothetical protein
VQSLRDALQFGFLGTFGVPGAIRAFVTEQLSLCSVEPSPVCEEPSRLVPSHLHSNQLHLVLGPQFDSSVGT